MDNFYIKLHKGAEKPFYKQKDPDSEFFKGKSLLGETKKRDGKDVIVPTIADFIKGYNQFDEVLIKSLWFRQLLHAQSLCEGFPKRLVSNVDTNAIDEIARQKVELFEEAGLSDYHVNWRLAIGMGNASIFENSLTLHHIYGIPYIPASAVKGIVRSWLIQEYFSKDSNIKDSKGSEYSESGEGKALRNESFCYIFGTPPDFEIEKANNETGKKKPLKHKSIILDKDGSPTAHQGNVVFFDAYPINKPNVVVDIINPHYPDYYNEKNPKPPADWQNPVPIFFLTIKDTDFQFLFGVRKGCIKDELEKLEQVSFEHPSEPEYNKKGSVVDVLNQLLEEALGCNGAGAKTSTGYGRMSSLTREKRLRLNEEKQTEELKRVKEAEDQARIQQQKDLEAKAAAEAELRRKENLNKRREVQEQYRSEGLYSKLELCSNFKQGKEVVSDFKKVVGELDNDDQLAIKDFVRECYSTADSKNSRSRWLKDGKGDWGTVASWVGKQLASKWFTEIIK